jgi:hypothetical protein
LGYSAALPINGTDGCSHAAGIHAEGQLRALQHRIATQGIFAELNTPRQSAAITVNDY